MSLGQATKPEQTGLLDLPVAFPKLFTDDTLRRHPDLAPVQQTCDIWWQSVRDALRRRLEVGVTMELNVTVPGGATRKLQFQNGLLIGTTTI